MKTIIIDDEKQIREGLKILLEYQDVICLVGEAKTVAEGKEKIEALKPDLVLLDIQLQNSNGFEMLEQLEYLDFKLIFITAYNEYAIKAFKYNAFDYLLKPIDPQELNETIQRLHNEILSVKPQLQNLKNNTTLDKLVVKTTEETHILILKNIVHCEANEGYTFFYLVNGKRILSSKTLKEYDILLSKSGFLRVHQSHLVNISHIKSYNKNGKIILANNNEVPISVRRKKEVLAILK